MRSRLLAVVWLAVPALAAAGEGPAGPIPQGMAALGIQLGVLLCATQGGGALARRLRLPGLIGELIAGIVVGPFALGALPLPGMPSGLFGGGGSLPVSREMLGLCWLAGMLLVFMLGLQTDLRLFLRHSAAGTAGGLGGALAAFALGDLAGVVFAPAVFGRPAGPMDPGCLMLGVAAVATSVGLTARILAEDDRMGSPEAVTTLAGAVVDDVLGMVALTVVLTLGSARGTPLSVWEGAAAVTGKALGAWAVAVMGGVLLARRLGGLLQRFRGRTTAAILAFGAAAVLAGLYEGLGLTLIVGAYVAGLTLSRTVLMPVIREKLDPLHTVLTPLFFGVVGVLTDVGAFRDWRVAAFGLSYAVLGAAAKLVGCGGAAMLFGFPLSGALRVGLGMVPRGEVALLVGAAGLTSGLLSPEAFAGVVLMSILTALGAPPALRRLVQRRRPLPGERGRTGTEGVLRFPFADPRQAAWVFRGLHDTLYRDGFFVHVLEQGGGAVLALRGKSAIAFRREDNDIVFHCAPAEVPVVKTAVLYVVREVRTTVEAMRRTLDMQQVLREVPGGAAAGEGNRDLRPFLRPDLVKLRLKGDTPESILRELVELVSAAGLVDAPEEVLAAVLAREQSMSTGLERGIAVPHCRTDSVRGLVCAIGLKPEGVDFGALDGQPSRVFVLTLSPVTDPAPHVLFMSQIVQALTPAVCRRLLRAESTHEAIAILSSREEGEGVADGAAGAEAAPPRPPVAHPIRPNALKSAVVVPRLAAADRDGAIEELVTALAARHPISGDLEQVKRQILQREQIMSSGLERGIAVPHCRTGAVDRVLCAVGLKPEGLDFGSQDGAPTQIVVLILASTSTPTPYAQTLALVLHALNRVPRAELFGYTDAEALHARLLKAVEDLGVSG